MDRITVDQFVKETLQQIAQGVEVARAEHLSIPPFSESVSFELQATYADGKVALASSFDTTVPTRIRFSVPLKLETAPER